MHFNTVGKRQGIAPTLDMSRFPRFLLRKTKDHNSSTSRTGIFLQSTGCSVTVILRATGRICAIFNEIFALTLETNNHLNLFN